MAQKRKQKQNQKGSRNYNPKRRDYKEERREEDVKSSTNDVAWYEMSPELLRDAASLPFSFATGTTYNRSIGFTPNVPDSSDQVVPGIMTLSIAPIIGDSLDLETASVGSPLNIASNALFSYVRHANSGAANYSAPNLMMYCLAMSNVYSYLNFLMRIYGTCQLYSHYNRYLPKAVIESQNVDFDDLISNLADFRYGVNSLINKAASFAVPANMPFFNRIAFLFSGIYSEGETVKDQLYMYVPEMFFVLSEKNSKPGWQLKSKQFQQRGGTGRANWTHTQLIAFGNEMLNPLLMSESINIMSGDIFKAFGGNILALQSLPEVYNIMPTTDLTVLEQFQNSDFMINYLDNDTNSFALIADVVEDPDTNLIVSSVGVANTTTGAIMASVRNDHVLTTILTDPKPGDVIERTRLMTCYSTFNDGTVDLIAFQSGSEFACVLTIWDFNPSTGAIRSTTVRSCYDHGATSQQSAVQEIVNIHCMLENFKFHPTVYYFTSSGSTFTYYNAAVDIDNYTVVAEQTLRKMHEAALLSLFRVQSIA